MININSSTKISKEFQEKGYVIAKVKDLNKLRLFSNLVHKNLFKKNKIKNLNSKSYFDNLHKKINKKDLNALRMKTIKSIYEGLNDGGAFIFSEKGFSCNPKIQDMMTFMYYDYKRQHFTDKEILDKEEVQLRHMMKPNTKTEMFDMCYDAGFKDLHVFWQNFNFYGVIALK